MEEPPQDDSHSLKQGRERIISDNALFFLLILRGAWGSVTDKVALERLIDSMTIFQLQFHFEMKSWPKSNTIIENLNCISNKTRLLILKRQAHFILGMGFDTFDTVLIDSTSVKANSAYPTDITVLNKLVCRFVKCFGKLSTFGILFNDFGVDTLQKSLHSHLVTVNLTSGKGAKEKRKKAYKQALKIAQKLLDHCIKEQDRMSETYRVLELDPLKREQLNILWDKIEGDLQDTLQVIYYAALYSQHGIALPSRDKILSISDCSAAFIEKGGRQPVVGYKPQIARSGNGFIVGLVVPEGNAADSAMLKPTLEQVIYNTGRIPSEVSLDDGYDGPYVNELLEQDVAVSVGGAKGRRRVGDVLWESPQFTGLRNIRSAVESGMFTLKYSHYFGQMRRRGIDGVRAEMLEKVISYNFRHILRKLKEQEKLAS